MTACARSAGGGNCADAVNAHGNAMMASVPICTVRGDGMRDYRWPRRYSSNNRGMFALTPDSAGDQPKALARGLRTR